MISCLVNDLGEYLRIVMDDVGSLRIPFDTYYDNRKVRQFLSELSRGQEQVYSNDRFIEWSVFWCSDSHRKYRRLKTEVLRHVPLSDRSIRVTKTNSYIKLRKGTTELSICAHSHRWDMGELHWFDEMLSGCPSTLLNCLVADQDFATLEDSISSTSDYDACYTVEARSLVQGLLEGSVLA